MQEYFLGGLNQGYEPCVTMYFNNEQSLSFVFLLNGVLDKIQYMATCNPGNGFFERSISCRLEILVLLFVPGVFFGVHVVQATFFFSGLICAYADLFDCRVSHIS
ncbi:MAG: hypothetical protein DKINENOH_05641 [bacterium]|nr:hypothetical protein [bacterium]